MIVESEQPIFEVKIKGTLEQLNLVAQRWYPLTFEDGFICIEHDFTDEEEAQRAEKWLINTFKPLH